MRALVLAGLNEEIRQCVSSVGIDLTAFPLMANEDDASNEVADTIEAELISAGYSISWDGPGHMYISLEEELGSPTNRRALPRKSTPYDQKELICHTD